MAILCIYMYMHNIYYTHIYVYTIRTFTRTCIDVHAYIQCLNCF